MIKEFNLRCPNCGKIMDYQGDFNGDDKHISILVYCKYCDKEYWVNVCKKKTKKIN